MDGNGCLYFANSDGTMIGSASTGAISINTWYTIEIKITIANSGSAILMVDSVEWLNLSEIDTQSQSTDAINYISFCHPNMGVYTYWDNIVVYDDTGDVLNDFVGTIKIDCLVPNADTAQADFTPSAGSDNYATVDETTTSDAIIINLLM